MPLARPSHRIMTQMVERQVEVREGSRPCFLVARDTPCELITNSPKKALYGYRPMCVVKRNTNMVRAGCVNGDLHQTKAYKRVGLTWGSSATECPTTWRTPRQTEEHVPTSPIARACISIHSIGPSKPDDERVRAFFRALSSGASSSRGLLLPPFFFRPRSRCNTTPASPPLVRPRLPRSLWTWLVLQAVFRGVCWQLLLGSDTHAPS